MTILKTQIKALNEKLPAWAKRHPTDAELLDPKLPEFLQILQARLAAKLSDKGYRS